MAPDTDLLKETPRWMLLLNRFITVTDVAVRAGYLAQPIQQHWTDLERSEQDRINRSIDHPNLANKAVFTFMAEEWGITEHDVVKKVDEIYTAELQAFSELVDTSPPGEQRSEI